MFQVAKSMALRVFPDSAIRIARRGHLAVHIYYGAIIRWQQTKRRSRSSARKVFSEIYHKNLWGGTGRELYSGPGSRYEPAALYLKTIIEFIKANRISTVLDLGCGDFVIGKEIAAVCDVYTGVDVVPELIERNTQIFGSDRIQFICLDVAFDKLPDAQLCLIRQVLQHLSNEEILRVLAQVRKYPHLIITEHYPSNPRSYNIDQVHGAGTRVENGSGVYLDKAPFNATKLELLAEMPPMTPSKSGEIQMRRDWGLIRTYKVTL